MPETVRLVFNGEMLAGFDPVDVMARVAHALNVDEERMALLFSGQRIVLRRGVELERARRYAMQFARMGARLHLEADDDAVAAAPAPAPAAPDVPAPTAAAQDAGYGHYRRRRPRPTADGARVWGIGLDGRLGRQPYAAAGSIAIGVTALATALVAQQASPLRLGVAAGAWLLVTLLSWRWTVLRLHDSGRSGRWALAVALPWLGVLAGAAIASLRGTRGPNAYGDEPRRGRPVVTLLAAAAVSLATAAGLWAIKAYLTPLRAQLRGQAAAVFNGHYPQASEHKAFALSPGGAWGWRSGLPSRGAAVYEALANCEKHRKPDKPRCEVIDIDGAPPLPSD